MSSFTWTERRVPGKIDAMISGELVSSIPEEEYLAGEQFSEEKHEYCDGRIYTLHPVYPPRSAFGSTDAHELVAGNIFAALLAHLRGKGCRVFKSDMKLRLQFRGKTLHYYPDIMVACDPADAHPLYRRGGGGE